MNEPPIKGFIPNTLIDWEGKVAAEVFLSGCNLRCPFCHSPHLVFGDATEHIPLVNILQRLRIESSWVDGVVVSGGEPTLCSTLDSLCAEFKRLNLAVKIDTNGTKPDVLKRLIEAELLDFISLDIKAPLDERYNTAAGIENAHVERIEESITLLKEETVDYEFRTTVVPTLHDWDALKSIGESLAGGGDWVLQQFRPKNCLNPEYERIKPYPLSFLKEWAERLCLYLPTRVRGEFD